MIEACGLPEIGTELMGRSVRIGLDLKRPYMIDGSAIIVDESISDSLWESACALREATELLAIGGNEPRWAHRIVASATAAIYSETLLRERQERGRENRVVKPSFGQRLLANDNPDDVAADIARFIASRDNLDAPGDGEVRAASRALPLAYPTEVLLTLGGDHRQQVDWNLGVNSYGLSPRPVPWRTQYGSCTASSPSPRAFAAARRVRHDLVAAAVDDVLDDSVEAIVQETRTSLLSFFNIGPEHDVEVVLTPSGTDAEYVALALTMPEAGSLLSIVLAPSEIGSGSLNAAAGRHFSELAPFGSNRPGETLQGVSATSVSIVTVEVRGSVGELRDPTEVEAEMYQHICSSSGPVLVHAVEGTKTGVRLPRTETLRKWESEFGARLTVVVDAAQVRIDQDTVSTHVSEGRIVFVTGSKFFGGPPFSGAVFVPGRIADKENCAPIPGLAHYLGQSDVPERLGRLRTSVANVHNNGLILRWTAAIAEITSFLNASPEIRDEILRRLALGVRRVIDSSPHLRLVESPYTQFPSPDDRGLDDLPTIFSFVVVDSEGRIFDLDATRRIHRLLVKDLSAERGVAGDAASHKLARQPFHVGQPVSVSYPDTDYQVGALRIAIGAPTLSQIVFDFTRGIDWLDRLELEVADIQAAIEKIAMTASVLQDEGHPETVRRG